MLSVKKAIVDFVLKDPNDPLPKTAVNTTKERSEVKELSKLFKDSYIVSKKYLLNNLHIVNPLLGHLLDLWFKSYRYFILFIKSYYFDLLSYLLLDNYFSLNVGL